MVDELQMARALEVLERLKAEKAWAYSQIKKPRVAPVQKAHWDHLLDEMVRSFRSRCAILLQQYDLYLPLSRRGCRSIFARRDVGKSPLLIVWLSKLCNGTEPTHLGSSIYKSKYILLGNIIQLELRTLVTAPHRHLHHPIRSAPRQIRGQFILPGSLQKSPMGMPRPLFLPKVHLNHFDQFILCDHPSQQKQQPSPPLKN
jgi:hypothetical protein